MKCIPYQRWLPALLACLDGAWALSALATSAPAKLTSTVSMINPVVWIFLHLPAALLGSLPWQHLPQDAPLPAAQLWLIGALGMAQTAALAWWWAGHMDRRGRA